jgi:hypothetical protein
MQSETHYKVGKGFVAIVPPGWTLAGRVAEVTDTHVVLRPAVWLESVNSGQSVFSLGDPKNAGKTHSTTWPMAELNIRKDVIMFDFQISDKALLGAVGKQALDALDGAK